MDSVSNILNKILTYQSANAELGVFSTQLFQSLYPVLQKTSKCIVNTL